MAGFEDEPAPAPERARSEWAQQLEKSYTSATGTGAGGGSRDRAGNPMVKIIGYEGGGGGGGGRAGGSDYGGGRTMADSEGPRRSGGGYDQIAGALGQRVLYGPAHCSACIIVKVNWV